MNWIRRFHETGEGLWSNLVNHGDPYAVLRLGLQQSIKSHVVPDGRLTLTHLLSFSSSRERALFFARHRYPTEEEMVDPGISESTLWRDTQYVLFAFDVTRRSPIENAAGLFTITYGGNHQALVIDVLAYLSVHAGTRRDARHLEAMENAARDSEWLVLPFDRLGDGTLSALLMKSADLSAIHFVRPEYFTERQR